MVKLLLCVGAAFVLAVISLQLRQQRLNLNYQKAELAGKIESQQSKLWNQQLQIAVYTAPNAISQTVANQKLKMVPQAPLPARQTIDPEQDVHAE